jgi:hypothetical protein
MVINFCGKYNSAIQNVKIQKIYINCDKSLNFKRIEIPDSFILSKENSFNELFEFGDNPVSNQKTLINIIGRFDKLSGDDEIAKQTSINKITKKAIATNIPYANDITNTVNIIKKSISGKKIDFYNREKIWNIGEKRYRR